MANPLVNQGTLNRLIASIVWTDHPELNIIAANLGRAGISLALQGETTLYIPTMTGQVTSPEPYMGIEVTATILKSQPLANAYKQRMESNALIGDGTVRPDTTTLGVYQLTNCAIKNVHQLTFSGEDAAFAVVFGGYYLINSSLWG